MIDTDLIIKVGIDVCIKIIATTRLSMFQQFYKYLIIILAETIT